MYKNTPEQNNAKPFIKWAGGKGQLLPKIREYFPFDEYDINKYCEPFIGAGAVLFDILNKYDIEKVYISDINSELINTYKVIKNNVYSLIELLENFQTDYLPLDDVKRKEYYYSKRIKFNELKKDLTQNQILRAANFIFLNKTGFNGLYRENSSGGFNVPIGSYVKPLILDKDNLIAVSKKLKKVEIHNSDYRKSIDFIDDHTFVYFDPPYRPLNATSSFTSYSKNSFNDENQIELSNYYKAVNKKGALLLLSNSDPKNTNEKDNFFDDLYEEFFIKRVKASRFINSNKSKRGEINELLISNFKKVEDEGIQQLVFDI